MGAVMSGCIVYPLAGLALGAATLAFVFLFDPFDSPDEAQAFMDSRVTWTLALLFTMVVGLVAGLVTGLKAKGREFAHVIVLLVLSFGVGLTMRTLRAEVDPRDLAISEPEQGPVWEAAGFAASCGSPIFGALIARTIRRRREAGFANEGLRVCSRCGYPMEADALVCPRCGDVVVDRPLQ